MSPFRGNWSTRGNWPWLIFLILKDKVSWRRCARTAQRSSHQMTENLVVVSMSRRLLSLHRGRCRLIVNTDTASSSLLSQSFIEPMYPFCIASLCLTSMSGFKDKSRINHTHYLILRVLKMSIRVDNSSESNLYVK